jgi:hypothetical protein
MSIGDVDMVVRGESCLITMNHNDANSIELGKHLLLLHDDRSDSGIWVDKYDIRMIMKNGEEFLNYIYDPSTPIPHESEEDYYEDLQYERYQDILDYSESNFLSQDDCKLLDENVNTNEANKFMLPQYFPTDLLPQINIPSSKHQYDIIMHTAKTIRSRGQMEVLLKVKQYNNPLFNFLKCDDDLNPFYEVIIIMMGHIVTYVQCSMIYFN